MLLRWQSGRRRRRRRECTTWLGGFPPARLGQVHLLCVRLNVSASRPFSRFSSVALFSDESLSRHARLNDYYIIRSSWPRSGGTRGTRFHLLFCVCQSDFLTRHVRSNKQQCRTYVFVKNDNVRRVQTILHAFIDVFDFSDPRWSEFLIEDIVFELYVRFKNTHRAISFYTFSEPNKGFDETKCLMRLRSKT